MFISYNVYFDWIRKKNEVILKSNCPTSIYSIYEAKRFAFVEAFYDDSIWHIKYEIPIETTRNYESCDAGI